MRLPTKASAWGRRDAGSQRRPCVGCGLSVGCGVPHAGGCPIRYPDAPPGIFYLPAQAAQLAGMARQSLGPAANRQRLGVPRKNDPPFVEISGKLWIEREAFVRWMTQERPKWLVRMQAIASGTNPCFHCKKTRGHEESCPGKITLAKLHEIRKMPGRCGSCGRLLKAMDFGNKTCRKCRSADARREKLRKKALSGQISP